MKNHLLTRNALHPKIIWDFFGTNNLPYFRTNKISQPIHGQDIPLLLKHVTNTLESQAQRTRRGHEPRKTDTVQAPMPSDGHPRMHPVGAIAHFHSRRTPKGHIPSSVNSRGKKNVCTPQLTRRGTAKRTHLTLSRSRPTVQRKFPWSHDDLGQPSAYR